ncbi:hypothetical protein BO94DRAFT_110587 [Aspergillus sclerotioniger CBS 115572]|uniref:Secreted protein n=1 Tax=Aspergillus sclerotioniger CBS 115572 TaxID=1450535 RepID=A0A317WKI4_9EURO|nr:hypothetical protein BO94DRAFT_110587 [Aspergillus sclerotioniger CBS 115572]PWY84700.1 hypothetical protein BO94DRAFT_110587 [Aspergillus sclerotioniger CBS 115572]
MLPLSPVALVLPCTCLSATCLISPPLYPRIYLFITSLSAIPGSYGAPSRKMLGMDQLSKTKSNNRGRISLRRQVP